MRDIANIRFASFRQHIPIELLQHQLWQGLVNKLKEIGPFLNLIYRTNGVPPPVQAAYACHERLSCPYPLRAAQRQT